MKRSAWKGGYKYYKSNSSIIQNNNNGEGGEIGRNEIITPEDLGKTYLIKGGKNEYSLEVRTIHIGHKFGEFFVTKKPAIYKRNSKRK
jgi:ribosomal protein S19